MAVFLISCLIWIVPVASFEWTHHMILDQDGMFHILWKPEKDKITFELQVSYMSSDHENTNSVLKIVMYTQNKYFDSIMILLYSNILETVAINELLCMKNAGT